MTIDDRVVLFVIRSKIPGHIRSADVDVVTDAEKSRLRHTKTLWTHAAYKAVIAVVQRARRDLRRYYALPCTVHDGVYLVPVGLQDAATGMLNKHAEEFYGKVNEFCDAYPGLVKQAKEQLRSLFNPDDYPPVDVIRQRFKFDWLIFQFTPSDGYSGTVVQDISSSSRDVLRAELVQLMDRLIRSLVPQEEGKRATLRTSTVNDTLTWLENLPARNISDDETVVQLADRIKALVVDKDIDELRADKDQRQSVAKAISAIRDEAVTLFGVRKIDLSDSDVSEEAD